MTDTRSVRTVRIRDRITEPADSLGGDTDAAAVARRLHGPNDRACPESGMPIETTPMIHRRMWPARLQVVMVCLIASAGTLRADEPAGSLTDPSRPQDIDRLIADLAHSSYDQRTFATRRLCAIGMKAYEALRNAARGANAERGLRARSVMTALDRLLFAGVDVRLALSRSEVAWDEPVALAITLTNRSEFPARVPFELDPSARSRHSGDARQVADLIDVAEWLRVTDADGDEVSLRVDDITVDRSISKVVHRRLDDAPYSVLAPGERATLNVTAINRGWARYPLLDRGRYRMMLTYVPAWEDDTLVRAGVGRVTSNAVGLSVTTAAPATVSRRGADASLELKRDGDVYVVRITNRRDQTTFINGNLGGTAPFAQGRWVCERGEIMRDVGVIPQATMDVSDFQGRSLVAVKAGDAVELARIDRAELHKRLKLLGLDADHGQTVLYFSYSNLCDRSWQMRQDQETLSGSTVPAVLQEPLPRRMLTGWHTSNRLATTGNAEPD